MGDTMTSCSTAILAAKSIYSISCAYAGVGNLKPAAHVNIQNGSHQKMYYLSYNTASRQNETP